MAKRALYTNQFKAPLGCRPARPPGAEAQKVAAICFGLLVLVVWAFWPSLSNGFVNLDDPLYVTGNVHVQKGLTWESIRWAFTTLEEGFWLPLTWLSYLLDRQLFGPGAAGYHLTNLLLHAANTLLLFVALRRMTGALWRSAVVAALFALHPLHVESVAWISDRKDVLAGLFWMLSLLMYARYAQDPRGLAILPASAQASASAPLNPRRLPRSYVLSFLFFLCGLMSKGTGLTLPLVLLLLDWWPLGRCQPSAKGSQLSTLGRLIAEKLPFLAAGLLSAGLSLQGQKAFGALPSAAQAPLHDRIANALLSGAHYLLQTLWPAGLAAYYPYPKTFPLGLVAGAALLGVTASCLVVWAAHKRPYLAVGWFWYVVALLPVIGLVQVGGQSRADRYTYVPLIGLFLILAWGVDDLTRRWRHRSLGLAVAGAIVVCLCFGLTRRQLGYWKDSETLFRHAIAVTQDNALAQNNLGSALTEQARLDEAIACLQQAVTIAPGYAEAHNNLGTALAMQGRLDPAIAEFQEALRLKPNYAAAHNDLGAALGRKGRLDEAIAHLQQALRLAPGFADARSNLGDALSAKGRFAEAIIQYQQALRLNPNYPDTHNHLGIALNRLGRVDEAIEQFRQALRLNPAYAAAQANLRAALAAKAASPSPSGPSPAP